MSEEIREDAHQSGQPAELDAIVVGAGFAGLYALYRFRQLGITARVFETAPRVGGTWYWNCYPGARCDVESVDYSYSFSDELQQEWSWSERYPGQPELLRYLEHVADRFDLRRDIQLETSVTAAIFDEESSRWNVTTSDGNTHNAAFCVMATGCLSTSQVPNIRGLDSFTGPWFHTAAWPQDGVDLSGKRVGVIGTGSTGIQLIPEIVDEAAHVTVFQRTANFSVPSRNGPMDPAFERRLKESYPEFRKAARESLLGVSVEGTGKAALEVSPEERDHVFQERWDNGGGMPMLLAYTDLLVVEEANDTVADFFRARIRDAVVDPAVADLLQPKGFPIGSKRLCQHSEYYEIYNRDDITLVDVRSSPIEEITSTGIRTAAAEYELDCIIFATGFDAMTGTLFRIDIRGRDGQALEQKWADGPSAYLGLATAGFPNLFVVTGPGSPSVLSNVVVSVEQHVEWITDFVAYLRDRGYGVAETTVAAEEAWMVHVDEVAQSTLFPRADSWYIGANIPGKPRVFMVYVGGVGAYRTTCDEIAAKGYEGFVLS